ncbi:DUF4249 domain-containing protein [Fibrisoma montanum]|uniref:DUF4249 domain-containing protein n=1 Tax=Fibrisoma montanum TaxID=2305895 RepID=A0A418LZK3_9BACT|nr:DUF4249 domain-containing protein [Fibrisoma montanum]RIV18786.1 DUF4249 domain-containing protein [Fibrisoma montanum]
MIYRVLSLLLLTGAFSCTKDLGVDLPYEGNRLILYGVLSPDSVVTLRVGHSYPPTGRSVFDDGIQTAEVHLYEDSILVDKLAHQGEGFYVSTTSFKPTAGKSYYYQVLATGYPQAQSKPERIPDPVKFQNYKFDEVIRSTINSGFPTRKLTLSFIDDTQPDSYYAVDLRAYLEDQVLAINTFGLDRPDDVEDGCGFRSAGELNEYNLSDICFNGQSTIVRIGVELQGYIQPGGRVGSADEIILSLRRTNRGYYEYKRTFNAVEGFLQAFQPPQLRYSNIDGGYGIILVYSKDEILLKP